MQFYLSMLKKHSFIFQVRLGQVAENGEVHTKKLGKHHGRVHKLAVEPGSPHIFYSCGEDGLVQHVSSTFSLSKTKKSLTIYYF